MFSKSHRFKFLPAFFYIIVLIVYSFLVSTFRLHKELRHSGNYLTYLRPTGFLRLLSILIAVMLLTVPNSGCIDDDTYALPDTLPQFTRHYWGPTWNGQTIAFGYVPWIKIEEDSFIEIWDSSGIFLIDADGGNKRPFLLAGIAPFLCYPDFSPDGGWLVYVGGPGGVNAIHKAMINGDSITQLTFHNYWDRIPRWSPDGNKILFGRAAAPGDSCGLCLMNADGSKNRVLHCEPEAPYCDFLPDYRIVFAGWVNNVYGIWMTDTNGSYKHKISDTGVSEGGLNCSPDGSKILYCIHDEEKLQFEIWVMNVDGTNASRLCIDGIDPCWSPDGTEIVYVKYNFTKQAMTHPGYGELWLMDADGSNQRQLTFVE